MNLIRLSKANNLLCSWESFWCAGWNAFFWGPFSEFDPHMWDGARLMKIWTSLSGDSDAGDIQTTLGQTLLFSLSRSLPWLASFPHMEGGALRKFSASHQDGVEFSTGKTERWKPHSFMWAATVPSLLWPRQLPVWGLSLPFLWLPPKAKQKPAAGAWDRSHPYPKRFRLPLLWMRKETFSLDLFSTFPLITRTYSQQSGVMV